MPKIVLDIAELDLAEEEKFCLVVGDFKHIEVYGNGLVQVYRQGRRVLEINVLEMAEKADRVGFGT